MPAVALRGNILFMSILIAVVGASGVGKTTLVHTLAKAFPFNIAYEGHSDRPFQSLFKEDPRYALANQIDYLLLCAEQEKELRASPRVGLMDGGLDLDFHGFTRLFHRRGLLSDAELDLCRRIYQFLRETLPLVYGALVDSAIVAIPVGSLVPAQGLTSELPTQGLYVPVAGGRTLRVWPETRPGEDGPLVVRYRVLIAP